MKKEIKFEDIKNSPYTVVVLLGLVMVVIFGVTIWMLTGIKATKTEINDARALLNDNVGQFANLVELRARSEEAEEKLAKYDEILPEKLSDVYVLDEEIAKEMETFGLEVVSKEETTQESAATQETVFTFTVNGSYEDLMVYMQYVSGKKQIHRVDGFNLTVNEAGDYSATITIAVLSQNGAEGIASPVEEAVEVVSEAVAEDTTEAK